MKKEAINVAAIIEKLKSLYGTASDKVQETAANIGRKQPTRTGSYLSGLFNVPTGGLTSGLYAGSRSGSAGRGLGAALLSPLGGVAGAVPGMALARSSPLLGALLGLAGYTAGSGEVTHAFAKRGSVSPEFTPEEQAYAEGFMAKCADAGLDPTTVLASMEKTAQTAALIKLIGALRAAPGAARGLFNQAKPIVQGAGQRFMNQTLPSLRSGAHNLWKGTRSGFKDLWEAVGGHTPIHSPATLKFIGKENPNFVRGYKAGPGALMGAGGLGAAGLFGGGGEEV